MIRIYLFLYYMHSLVSMSHQDFRMGSRAPAAEGRGAHRRQTVGLGSQHPRTCRNCTKGLQCHLACTRAGTWGQLLAFLWCSLPYRDLYRSQSTYTSFTWLYCLIEKELWFSSLFAHWYQLQSFLKIPMPGLTQSAPLSETDWGSLPAILVYLPPVQGEAEGSWHQKKQVTTWLYREKKTKDLT